MLFLLNFFFSVKTYRFPNLYLYVLFSLTLLPRAKDARMNILIIIKGYVFLLKMCWKVGKRTTRRNRNTQESSSIERNSSSYSSSSSSSTSYSSCSSSSSSSSRCSSSSSDSSSYSSSSGSSSISDSVSSTIRSTSSSNSGAQVSESDLFPNTESFLENGYGISLNSSTRPHHHRASRPDLPEYPPSYEESNVVAVQPGNISAGALPEEPPPSYSELYDN